MNNLTFQEEVLQGIPDYIPDMPIFEDGISHAPKRIDVLNKSQKLLAIKNALRYFKPETHQFWAKEFARELKEFGRIYIYRLRPKHNIYARPINEYPAKSHQAAAIMGMIQNNLDFNIAQHPYELITYGGNGSVFQNWAQYRLAMKYLAEMTNEQTLAMYSGHPMGLFPSHKDAPRVIVTNGMVIPNYSSPNDYEKMNALGVSQYGQMTAGSYMYIGPQGIVHGTTITLMNAERLRSGETLAGKVFITSGLGGMSGAQAKASVIAGSIGIVAEINPKALLKRHSQGWLSEYYEDLEKLFARVDFARANKEAISIGYLGNIVDLWEYVAEHNIKVELGSDQTSLHIPYTGGYYPAGLSYDESNEMMTNNPDEFKKYVHNSLKRQVAAINKLTLQGMFFWDYGNAFMLEASRAGADIMNDDKFKYPSYVENIMGPLYFDYGFGPFRWVCMSQKASDLQKTDEIARQVLMDMLPAAPDEIKKQIEDNIKWITEAGQNGLVVGSQARILYADANGRINIAKAFNRAIEDGEISAPIVLGRDHHDVSGTDSPYRETANIYDGSQFTADMAVQNFVGDGFRGATWISLHNGGGVGWGEVINGGFGLVLDGTKDAERRLESMLFWDVNNGIARRNWARNKEATFAIKQAMARQPLLKVTIPEIADDELIKKYI
jgi:urocanate hydratase